jgi:small-conductance mechanosensitive channel
MARFFSKGRSRTRELPNIRAFESRTEVWQEVGLGEEINRGDARRARREAIVLLVVIIAVIVAFSQRETLFPDGAKAVRYITALVLAVLGWALARTVARGLAPTLMRRVEPGTAGTTGFLIRLGTMALVVIAALRIAGVKPETLAVGGAFTAVVLGLAAQQTLAHVFAGLVLLTTRPFRVGDRVKLRGGSMAGEVEGIVGNLGLFYTTLISGGDRTMIPNNVIMQLAVIPIAEPERVDLRAKFNVSVTPQRLQRMLEKAVTIPLRNPPEVTLEELDGDEITVNIIAVPLNPADGPKLSSDVLAAVRDSDLDGRPDGLERLTDEHEPAGAAPRKSDNGGPSNSGPGPSKGLNTDPAKTSD